MSLYKSPKYTHTHTHTRVAVEEVAGEGVDERSEPAAERVHVIHEQGIVPALRLGRLQEPLSRVSIGSGIVSVCQMVSIVQHTPCSNSIQYAPTDTHTHLLLDQRLQHPWDPRRVIRPSVAAVVRSGHDGCACVVWADRDSAQFSVTFRPIIWLYWTDAGSSCLLILLWSLDHYHPIGGLFGRGLHNQKI